MAKKRKKNKMPYYIASAMTVLAAASVGLVFYSGGLNLRKTPAPEAPAPQQIVTQASDGFVQKRSQVDYPLMPTELSNVFVSANAYGQFAFYEYANGDFKPCEDAKTMDIKASCSHQDIPTRLYYLQRDGKITGYGLFLTSLYEDDVRLYNYAFFHLVNMPQSYGSDDAMLLVDFDDADFAKTDKNYSEVFSLNLGSGKTQRLTSNNGRTVDTLGRFRTDWAQMNDALLQLDGQKIYLSGRNYQLTSDIADFIVNKDTSNTKPTKISSGVYNKYMHTENGTLYFVKPTDNGIDIYTLSKEGKETKKASYAGTVDDYLFSGDYMLEKNTLALTRVSTGENKGTLSTDLLLKAATDFSVSPDGKKLVLLCDGEQQTVALVNLADTTTNIVEDKGLFTTSCEQMMWTGNDTFLTAAEAQQGYEMLGWKF